MTAYYNEIDPFAAQWLRNLITAGLIAPGDVDERDIRDVYPDDLKPYTQCHFFAGIGVWSHALRDAGWPDDREVWTGSCPCQPFSSAGRRAGTSGGASGMADSNGGNAGAERKQSGGQYGQRAQDRSDVRKGRSGSRSGLDGMDDALGAGRRGWGSVDSRGDKEFRGRDTIQSHHTVRPDPTNAFWRNPDWLGCRDGKWRPVEPGTFPLVNGAACRVGRLRAYGNAIVAPQAEAFINAAMEHLP